MERRQPSHSGGVAGGDGQFGQIHGGERHQQLLGVDLKIGPPQTAFDGDLPEVGGAP